MNREIKFDYLIQSLDGEIYHCPYTLDQLEESTGLASKRLDGRVIARRQYTGLTDKNDVEIYEGDIVALWEVGSIYASAFELSTEPRVIGRGQFKWNAESAGFVHSWLEFSGDECLGTWRPSKRLWLAEDITCQLEVIGNIHDNPELLEVAG
ncbi:YopX family protein [Rhodococcus sp. NPDC004095]